MTDKNTSDIERLEKRLVREKSARLQAEQLLEEKSRKLYALNQKLNESATLFEAAIVHANDAVIITEAKLDGDGPKIIYANEAFATISGYSIEEVIGQTPRMLQGPETDRDVLDTLKKKLSAGEPFKGELRNYTKTGRAYWLDISIVPVKNSEGKITHFAAIERDITARKMYERELHESKKRADAANVAKSDFLATMSHELRTPMNGVLGMCEMLLDSSLDDDQRENAKTLHHSGETLLAILNDILDISKIEANELELEFVPFDIETAVNQIIQLFSPRAHEKNIALVLNKGQEVASTIIGDLGRIQQIIRNLVSNALKFTEKGSITVALSVITRNGNPFVRFAVEDTGVGIPADKLDLVFDKFTQADTSVTRKFGGTGLGLAISRQLVLMMGGDIGVDSILNEGSSFWFEIPMQIAKSDDKAINLYDNDDGTEINDIPSDIQILAVDDHPVNQLFVQKLLKKLGFTNVDMAENGREALDKIAEKTYDIVLMDCQMPELDGYQATTMLREQEGTGKHLPVIALTANAMIGDREKCLHAGMDDYLSKPIRPQKLMEMIKRHALRNEHAGASSADENLTIDSSDITIIDLEHLEIFTDGDPEEEKDLMNLFFSQADENIKSLEDELTASNNDGWKAAAHRFKGAAANLGANPLSLVCAQAEKEFEAPNANKEVMLLEIKSQLQMLSDFMIDRQS